MVLAANAIENATLLLASNAANSSGQVGRNLMDHPYLYAWGYSPTPVYPFRGPDTTSGVESLRDGRFREVHASFRASLANWGWSSEPGNQISLLLGAADLRRRVAPAAGAPDVADGEDRLHVRAAARRPPTA